MAGWQRHRLAGFETLNAAIQVLAEREVKGGEAGTALRNVILNLEKGTDKTLKPSVVGLSQALENLAGKNLSTKQAVKLFGWKTSAQHPSLCRTAKRWSR
jgi:hypothetical protein